MCVDGNPPLNGNDFYNGEEIAEEKLLEGGYFPIDGKSVQELEPIAEIREGEDDLTCSEPAKDEEAACFEKPKGAETELPSVSEPCK